MDNIVIAIISKGRPNFITKKLFTNKYPMYVFVDNDWEAEAYLENNENIAVVSCNTTGVSSVYNFITDYFNEGQKILMAIDDITEVAYRDGRTKWTLSRATPKQIEEIIEVGFKVCSDNNAKLWGVNPTFSGGIMLKDEIKFYSFIVGSMFGIINTKEIRYPEELTRKHDYFYSAEHLKRFGKTIRLDCFRTGIDNENKKGGGCGGTANDEKGKLACDYLIKNYPDIFKTHATRNNEVKLYFSAKAPRYIKFNKYDYISDLKNGGNL